MQKTKSHYGRRQNRPADPNACIRHDHFSRQAVFRCWWSIRAKIVNRFEWMTYWPHPSFIGAWSKILISFKRENYTFWHFATVIRKLAALDYLRNWRRALSLHGAKAMQQVLGSERRHVVYYLLGRRDGCAGIVANARVWRRIWQGGAIKRDILLHADVEMNRKSFCREGNFVLIEDECVCRAEENRKIVSWKLQ